MLKHDASRDAASFPVADSLEEIRVIGKTEKLREGGIASRGGDDFRGFAGVHGPKRKRFVYRWSNDLCTRAVHALLTST